MIVFALLWFATVPYREIYEPRGDDVTALADGLLLLPGAHWHDWFTKGYSNFFATYPEWPRHETAFVRPAAQFAIFLAHFVLGRDWASYLAINYLGVAGVAGVTFAIARTALKLSNGGSVLAATLVALSPAVVEFSIWQIGFASETWATLLVGCAFLALIARRDLLCLFCLLGALLNKETAVWTPFAAALTVLFRGPDEESPGHRAPATLAMLSPLILWLGFRFVFFGGIGGTYATLQYWPLSEFLGLTLSKLKHLADLYITPDVSFTAGYSAGIDRTVRIGSAVLLALLLVAWGVRALRTAWRNVGPALRHSRWPTLDAPLLVALWAAMGLGFHFAIALIDPRYATTAVMFVWPAVVAEAMRHRRWLLRGVLGVCFAVSLIQTSHFILEVGMPRQGDFARSFFRQLGDMNAALRLVPPDVRQVYVLSAGGLVTVNLDYLRAFLSVPAEIVDLMDIDLNCPVPQNRLVVDHEIVEGMVTLKTTLPPCGRGEFRDANIDASTIAQGRVYRNDSISYELPDAYPVEITRPFHPVVELGRRITVHIRPNGPARFLIERGGADGGMQWFDVP